MKQKKIGQQNINTQEMKKEKMKEEILVKGVTHMKGVTPFIGVIRDAFQKHFIYNSIVLTLILYFIFQICRNIKQEQCKNQYNNELKEIPDKCQQAIYYSEELCNIQFKQENMLLNEKVCQKLQIFNYREESQTNTQYEEECQSTENSQTEKNSQLNQQQQILQFIKNKKQAKQEDQSIQTECTKEDLYNIEQSNQIKCTQNDQCNLVQPQQTEKKQEDQCNLEQPQLTEKQQEDQCNLEQPELAEKQQEDQCNLEQPQLTEKTQEDQCNLEQPELAEKQQEDQCNLEQPQLTEKQQEDQCNLEQPQLTEKQQEDQCNLEQPQLTEKTQEDQCNLEQPELAEKQQEDQCNLEQPEQTEKQQEDQCNLEQPQLTEKQQEDFCILEQPELTEKQQEDFYILEQPELTEKKQEYQSNQTEYTQEDLPDQPQGRIFQNLHKSNFKSFDLIYNEKFTKSFTMNDMNELYSKLFESGSTNVIFCIAVEKQELLTLVACDFALKALLETQNRLAAQQSNSGQIFWYNYPGTALGFSSEISIELYVCDKHNPEDMKRLCISQNPNKFEGRIGNLNQLKQLEAYNIQIYMKKI